MERHADGLFHSELSKMNGNAYVQQLVKHLVGLKDRWAPATPTLLGQGSLQQDVGSLPWGAAHGAELCRRGLMGSASWGVPHGWEVQLLSHVVPTQVPEALGWAVHQWVQQDERQCPGSEIHPKPHGPQAQVRGNLWCPSPHPGSHCHTGPAAPTEAMSVSTAAVTTQAASAALQWWWFGDISCGLGFWIITNFLYLNQLSWPSQHWHAGERGSKQTWGTLLSLVIPELSEHQVGGRDWSPVWLWAPQYWSQKKAFMNSHRRVSC